MKAGNRTILRRGGFTLIELLVVLIIIAVLASLIMPAIQKALRKSRLTQVVNNGRNMYTALVAAEMEGEGGIFPASTNSTSSSFIFDNSTDYWRWVVTNGVMDVTFEYFAAYGVPACYSIDPEEFSPENNAWCVVADVDLGTHEMTPMYFTKNLHLARLNDELEGALSTSAPFGTYGVVVVNKGGSTRVIRANQLERQFNPAEANNLVLRP